MFQLEASSLTEQNTKAGNFIELADIAPFRCVIAETFVSVALVAWAITHLVWWLS